MTVRIFSGIAYQKSHIKVRLNFEGIMLRNQIVESAITFIFYLFILTYHPNFLRFCSVNVKNGFLWNYLFFDNIASLSPKFFCSGESSTKGKKRSIFNFPFKDFRIIMFFLLLPPSCYKNLSFNFCLLSLKESL